MTTKGREKAIDDLTPAEREQVQLALLRRWLALSHPKGTRRKTDGVGFVRRFDISGRPMTVAVAV
jgi:hypothetical protein